MEVDLGKGCSMISGIGSKPPLPGCYKIKARIFDDAWPDVTLQIQTPESQVKVLASHQLGCKRESLTADLRVEK